MAAKSLFPLIVVMWLGPFMPGAYAAKATSQAESKAATQPSVEATVREAARAGKLAFMVTKPEDLVALLGKPLKKEPIVEGEMEGVLLRYPKKVIAIFAKPKGSSEPFTLWAIKIGGRDIDIGRLDQAGRTVLKSVDDLRKIGNPFLGLRGASLVKLDLRSQGELLSQMIFDSQTEWPPADKLPKGFDPARVLEEGKNPGLGVRKLHAQSIDGRGVGIAIIDQPLVELHQEYKDRWGHYEVIDCKGAEPQLHGPAVASIAVGKSCGVAPKATLTYYAIPTWSKNWQDNKPYSELLNRILDDNRKAKPGERIRVVSISQGQFPGWPNYDLWTKAVKRAEAEGVVLCGRETMRYFLLRRIEGRDPDDPASYCLTKYGKGDAELLVLTENRTTASERGPDVYTYWREGGMSWAAPYLGGLAALAFQVNPDIAPARIIELWKQTATRTEVGPIVNPIGFIDAVKKSKTGT